MRSNTATTRRVRLVIILAVAAAVTVMLGAILVAASVVMRLLTRHDPANITRLGMDVVAAGVAFGLVVLVVFAIARIGTARKVPAACRYGGSPAEGASARNRRHPTGPASHQGAAHRRGTARTGSALAPRPQAAVTAAATAERVPAGRPC